MGFWPASACSHATTRAIPNAKPNDSYRAPRPPVVFLSFLLHRIPAHAGVSEMSKKIKKKCRRDVQPRLCVQPYRSKGTFEPCARSIERHRSIGCRLQRLLGEDAPNKHHFGVRCNTTHYCLRLHNYSSLSIPMTSFSHFRPIPRRFLCRQVSVIHIACRFVKKCAPSRW